MLSARDVRLHSDCWTALLICTSVLTLQGCVAPFAAVGATGSAAVSSAGTAAASTAAAYPVTATSLASSAVTGKSPLEHAASAATKKECNFLNSSNKIALLPLGFCPFEGFKTDFIHIEIVSVVITGISISS